MPVIFRKSFILQTVSPMNRTLSKYVFLICFVISPCLSISQTTACRFSRISKTEMNYLLFAVIAPVSGFYDYLLKDSFKKIPIWIFHGAKDDLVPLDRAVSIFESIRRSGGNVKITVYSEAGHDAWTETYNNPDLYKWFLQHSKISNIGARHDTISRGSH